MKTTTTILAALLAAVPMTAFAQQARYDHPTPHVSQSTHVSQTTRVSQSSLRQTVVVQRNVSVGYAPRYVQPLPVYRARPDVVAYVNQVNFTGWHWNGGVAWVGFPRYWGYGFWGDFAVGVPVASYTVAENSPGAQLLANYNLTQGPCDQDNMVQIYGPDNSEICAYPNNLVSPGQYQIDMSDLSLVSQ